MIVNHSWFIGSAHLSHSFVVILDLDPNKSLASQIGEESAGESDTIASTAPSIDASGTSGFSRNTRNSFPTSILDERNKVNTVDEVAGAMPPNQIFDYKNDDDKSDASSITTFREIQGDKSTIDATRLLSVLDRIETQLADQGVVETSKSAEIPAPPRFTDADEVEKRLTELIEKFGTKKSVEAHTDMSNEQRELMEKSQAIFTKLSALLSNRMGLPDNGDVQKPPEQSSLESLPALLTQVLEKLEKTSVDDVMDSNKESDKLREREQGAQPPILCEDPEYSKYFKMLKLGLPRTAVMQALERDGQDKAVLDMDPNRPFTEQKREAVDEQPKAEKNAELKALFAKRAARLKDSNQNAALEALFAERSGTAHQEGSAHQEGTAPILKDDPEFQKYMRMLKVGMPKEKVRQALERDGKDQAVADMDPDKTYASQVRSAISEPPLSEDEEYAKFFKVCSVLQLCAFVALDVPTLIASLSIVDAQGSVLLLYFDFIA